MRLAKYYPHKNYSPKETHTKDPNKTKSLKSRERGELKLKR